MWNWIIGVFMVLHGAVHMLYFGPSRRIFELQPGLQWPDGAWAFSGFMGVEATRWLACIGCVVAALGFAAGGAGLFLRQAWWRPLVIASAIFSIVLYLLLWDGRMQRLDDKGAVGILINAVILAVILVLQWPQFEF